jgi:hypothetical protein
MALLTRMKSLLQCRDGGDVMARLGWLLVLFGLATIVVSASPFVFVMVTSDDPSVNPAIQGMLMAVGGFAGILMAAFGGAFVHKARTGKWPLGF